MIERGEESSQNPQFGTKMLDEAKYMLTLSIERLGNENCLAIYLKA